MICFFSLLDLLSPCLTGTWQEAAMLIVVVKYTSMSQSVDQMELHTLTLVWLAVLIVVILALGWVYFASSRTVVNLTSCDKDMLEFRGKHVTSVSLFKKLQITYKTPVTKIQRKENEAIPPSSQKWLECLGVVICSPVSPLLLYIGCQLSETW